MRSYRDAVQSKEPWGCFHRVSFEPIQENVRQISLVSSLAGLIGIHRKLLPQQSFEDGNSNNNNEYKYKYKRFVNTRVSSTCRSIATRFATQGAHLMQAK